MQESPCLRRQPKIGMLLSAVREEDSEKGKAGIFLPVLATFEDASVLPVL